MKKYYLFTLLALFALLSGCSSNKNSKVLYKIDKQTSYSTDEMLETLDDYKDGLVIYIVLKSEYVSDDYKSLVEPGMTAQEIDELIKEMRSISKQYFTNLNQDFIDEFDLNKFGVVEFASYSSNITIYLGDDEVTVQEINELIEMSQSDQVEFVEIRRFK
ncbi:hypothetical protein N7603_08255 [Acholeplasma vituli]|uniref:DUF1307 domain-containing protein n=1 Tax=Paracholeplasma vituli TaxID=69473 RepID=A0ABT2PZ71_9MOLU|nr:hypothetical protein [Paracholeplasma vituli]MCU0105649.1 hypothetical protein [Paracholeplasma vituli]